MDLDAAIVGKEHCSRAALTVAAVVASRPAFIGLRGITTRRRRETEVLAVSGMKGSAIRSRMLIAPAIFIWLIIYRLIVTLLGKRL